MASTDTAYERGFDMFCQNCGGKLEEGAKFCRFCGNSLTRLTEVSSKTVFLVNCGRNKLNVIKEIRALTGLGLKEAMQLTDNTPSTLQSSVSSAETEEIKKSVSINRCCNRNKMKTEDI